MRSGTRCGRPPGAPRCPDRVPRALSRERCPTSACEPWTDDDAPATSSSSSGCPPAPTRPGRPLRLAGRAREPGPQDRQDAPGLHRLHVVEPVEDDDLPAGSFQLVTVPDDRTGEVDVGVAPALAVVVLVRGPG